jgi:hypothetical protein
MKIRNIFTTTLLAIASAGLMASHADAALVDYSRGNLLLGFYTTGNGSGFDYVVNLGPAAGFRDGTTNGLLSINGIDADLDSIFGGDWNTRDDVFWGIFGASGTSTLTGGLINDPAATNYATKPQLTLGEHQLGFSRNSASSQQTNAGGKINSAGTAFKNAINSTANNPVGVVQTLPSNDSFASFITNGGLTNFASFDNAMGNFGAGASGTALDLFRMAPAGGATGVTLGTAGDRIGTFRGRAVLCPDRGSGTFHLWSDHGGGRCPIHPRAPSQGAKNLIPLHPTKNIQ